MITSPSPPTHLAARAATLALQLPLLLILAATATAELYDPGVAHDVDLLDSGNLLVTDGGQPGAGGGGIFEIDRDGNIVWSYEIALDWPHNADRQADGTVVISDTGNNRVLIVDHDGIVLWDSDSVPLSDGSTLDYPNDANLLDTGNLLITDRNNHRVIEIDVAGNVIWQFGLTGVPGAGPAQLNGPHNADRLSGGNTIVADSNNGRILEVALDGSIQWEYAVALDWPRDADRLASGNTLINDSGHQRIVEVTLAGTVVWEYFTGGMSYDSDRLPSGNTLLSEQGSIVEVDGSGQIVWSYPVVYQTETIEGYLVTAPNGSQLWTKVIQPRADIYAGQTFPAVVNVSGGLGAGETGDQHLAADGFVELHFNAEGRGVLHPSDGVEDHNGFAHQDDLKAVIEYALTLPNVMPDNVGVVTGSYGITMGAGCLGRYPALQVKYLLDVEGPSESFVTCFEPWALDEEPSNDRHETGYAIFGHWSVYRDSSQANLDWWTEREATRYIGNIRCAYMRVQAEWDHAQPPSAQYPEFDYPPLWYQNKHGVDLINLATEGTATWTRMNGEALGNPPSTTYSYGNPAVWYDQVFSGHLGEREALIKEMAALDLPSAVADEQPGTQPGAPAETPFVTRLAPCHPNPFNPVTTLRFELARAGNITLAVHDLAGRKVRVLTEGRYAAGRHAVLWDGRCDRGLPAPSGTYLIRLVALDEEGTRESSVQKVALIK